MAYSFLLRDSVSHSGKLINSSFSIDGTRDFSTNLALGRELHIMQYDFFVLISMYAYQR